MSSFSNQIQQMVSSIIDNQLKIKEEFCKAYLATHTPLNEDQLNYIIQNIEMVEERKTGFDGKMIFTWYFRMKDKKS